MLQVLVKIASASGQRWRGVFERLARQRLGRKRDADSGAVQVANAVYEGFVAKFTRKGNRIEAKVVEPNGYYIGFTSGSDESSFFSPLSSTYLYDANTRDAYNPALDMQSTVHGQSTHKLMPIEVIIRFGDPFFSGDLLGYWHSVVQPYEADGVCGGYFFSNTSVIHSSPHNPERPQLLDGTLFGSAFNFFPKNARETSIYLYEENISNVIDGYFMCSRYSRRAKLSRQTPRGACAVSGNRQAIVMPLTTNPDQATNNDAFPHIGGMVGVMIFVGINSKDSYDYKIHFLSLNNMNLNGIEAEKWSSGIPWVQEYMTPSGTLETVTYNPAGNYVLNGFPLSGYLSSAFGVPTVCFLDNSLEVLIDLRVARTWVDGRGIDKYPELRPVTIQTQTAVVKLRVSGFSEEDGTLGSLSASVVTQDASGSTGNGCFLALGGSHYDAHYLWRTTWSGNAGGRHVALLSVVKHARFEGYDEEGWLNTAQSSFSKATRLHDEPLALQLYVNGHLTEHSCSALGFCIQLNPNEYALRHDDYLWPTGALKWATVAGDNLVFFCAYTYPTASHMLLIRWNVVTGSLTEIRRDPVFRNGLAMRPAISCYQRQVFNDDKVEISPACLIYRIGEQNGYGNVYLSKDTGVTWQLLWGGEQSRTPAMGVYYLGSPIWHPEYGNIFKDYL